MSADVEILVSTLPLVLSVPSQAVVQREGKKQVFVANGKNIKPGAQVLAKLKTIEIGETNWSYTQVTKGLNEGEFVITTPEVEGLKDGAKVQVEQ